MKLHLKFRRHTFGLEFIVSLLAQWRRDTWTDWPTWRHAGILLHRYWRGFHTWKEQYGSRRRGQCIGWLTFWWDRR